MPSRAMRDKRAEELVLLYLEETGRKPDDTNLISNREIRSYFGSRITQEETLWIRILLLSGTRKNAKRRLGQSIRVVRVFPRSTNAEDERRYSISLRSRAPLCQN